MAGTVPAVAPSGRLLIHQVSFKWRVTSGRIRRDIKLGRLKAEKIGMVWVIKPADAKALYGTPAE